MYQWFVALMLLLVSAAPVVAEPVGEKPVGDETSAAEMPSESADEESPVAEPMPDAEFMQELSKRPATLDSQTLKAILEAIDKRDNPDGALQALATKIENNSESLTLTELMQLMAVLEQDNLQAIFPRLQQHEDVVIRFMTNVMLTTKGDAKAAEAVHELIHGKDQTLLEKRILKTWCLGMGVDWRTDDAGTILDHLTTMMSGEVKVKIGDEAPDFELKTGGGDTISLKDQRGKIVVLHFWSTNCGPCMAGMNDAIEALQSCPDEYVTKIFVSFDHEASTYEKAVAEYKMPYHNVRDVPGAESIMRSYGVNQLPYDFVIDGDGKVVSTELEHTIAHMGEMIRNNTAAGVSESMEEAAEPQN